MYGNSQEDNGSALLSRNTGLADRFSCIVILFKGPSAARWLNALADALRLNCRLPVLLLRCDVVGGELLGHDPAGGYIFQFGPSVVASAAKSVLGENDRIDAERILFIDGSEGSGTIPAGVDALCPRYNGHVGPFQLARNVLSGGLPRLSVLFHPSVGESLVLGVAYVAVPSGPRLERIADCARNRMAAFIVDVLTRRSAPQDCWTVRSHEADRPAGPPDHRGLTRSLCRILYRRIKERLLNEVIWSVGVRVRTDASEDLLPPGSTPFTLVKARRGHYYADPFLIENMSQTYLFFEDYDLSTRKAHISFVSIDRFGQITSEPRVALSLDYHLSYPFIFRAGGDIFMVPESSANRTIELFVAEDFPSRWRRYCVLMSELEAHDTTLFRDETGLWWMFTTLVRVGELGWDSVSVFYAESLFGPWHPHPMNPVRNDVRSSRSGGAVFSVAGRVFRPVQDCSQGYGSALAFCEIVELSPTRFREVVTKGPLRASAPPFLGVHTFNRSGQIEAMDFKHLRRRFAGLGEIQLPDRAALEAVESASPLPKVKFA